METLRTGIIGAGALGKALAAVLDENLTSIYARSKEKREMLYSFFPPTKISLFVKETVEASDLIILAVNDDNLENASLEIANEFGLGLEGKFIIHCSGSLDSSLLNSCSRYGAYTASAHPYQTFAVRDYNKIKEVFKSVYWGIEGQKLDVISGFIESTGGIPYKLSGETIKKKALYHASAIAAANYVTGAISLSSDLAKEAGIPQEFLAPIINTTVTNNLSSIPDIALSGPIMRGDANLIKKHLEALPETGAIAERYAYLGMASLEAAYNKALIHEGIYKKLKKIFLKKISIKEK